ncbi:C-terminal binding protein [Gulosibacter sp. 10]|uniref:C-terminal binding protein n=1 Tax=Gulosibacter sp. 10 TaxID=1255570 RepID=UPI00097F30FC|nr:C-terminal binding protein [Gulosibacter sp. 10]SJM67319.1 D-3-phosphoglycerate dehydrogenase [Gulosibacter sp. 10]
MAAITITDWGTLDPTEAVAYLEGQGHEVVLLDTLDPARIVERTPECDAIIASFIELSAETLAALPNLRVIATAAVGYNKIDIEAARSRGIDVCNMPPEATEEVSTHAVAGILGMLRELRPSAEQVEAGGWDYSALPMPPRVSELALGLFSFGRIARAVAERARPFFGRVIAYDPFVPEDAWQEGVERVDSTDALLAQSDVLSLHSLLTEQTRGFLGRENLAKLPEGAYVANVARGELIDEDALADALDAGRVRGAFLDVLETEPALPGNRLVRHPRAMVTPHAAFRSATTVRKYFLIPAENVCLVLAGERPHTLVN